MALLKLLSLKLTIKMNYHMVIISSYNEQPNIFKLR